MQSWAFQPSHMPHLTPTVLTGKLTKRDNDGTRDAIGHDDSEHTQHPGIHCSKFIFKCLLLFDVFPLCCGLGHDHAYGVKDEAWQAQQLHPIAHESRGNHVVHKEGSLVRQEDTFQPNCRIRRFSVKQPAEKKIKAGQTKGGQNQYHEDQKYVDFMHHYSVLCRFCPVGLQQSWVIHNCW